MFKKISSDNGWFSIREVKNFNNTINRFYLSIGTKKNNFGLEPIDNEIRLCDNRKDLLIFVDKLIQSLVDYRIEIEREMK